MADLQWIRYATGKEKHVPTHLAFDTTLQKQQDFKPIDGPQGKEIGNEVKPEVKKNLVAEGSEVPTTTQAEPELKTTVAENAPEGGAESDEIKEVVDPAKAMYEANKAGKAFAVIAKDLGIHHNQVRAQIKAYKAANNIIDETTTN